jgi:hypothetical protein
MCLVQEANSAETKHTEHCPSVYMQHIYYTWIMECATGIYFVLQSMLDKTN